MTKEERAKYDAQYRSIHKEALKLYHAQYHKDNKEVIRARSALWHKNNKAYHIQYCKDNKETIKIRGAQYYKTNKVAISIRRTLYRVANRETIKVRDACYRKTNPDLYALWDSNRARKLKRATPRWSETEDIKVVYLKRNEYRERYGVKFEVDHIIPILSDTVCGLHVLANLQLLDNSLNNSKHNYYQTDW